MRLAQANLLTKTDFHAKLPSLNRKILQNKSKHLLVESELNKLKTFDSSYFNSQSYFEEDCRPNYLVFQPINKYFKLNGNTLHILSWQPKGLSSESITPPSVIDNLLNPSLNYLGTKIRIRSNENCLKQSKISYTHAEVINIYIVYEINKKENTINNIPTLENCLFGAVTLTKNADIEKYGYSGCGIGFNRRSSFSFPDGEYGHNMSISGLDMSSSVHILVLGKRPTQELESIVTAEKMYSIKFSMGWRGILLKFALKWSKQLFNCQWYRNL